MASITDVAKIAGVSTATVSRTFNTPALINAQTQKRVLEAARQLNYQPRRARLPTVSDKTSASVLEYIGFQFFAAEPSDALLSNNFYASVLAGVQAEAAAFALHLLLHTTDRHSLSQEIPKMILHRAVGGILLVGTTDPAILATFAQHIPKIVLVDNRDETNMYESVISDGFGGAYAATRYLLELGHRHIGFFLGEPNVPTFQDRLHGYRCAQLDAGILPDPAAVISGALVGEREAKLGSMLCSSQSPTALIAANDDYAFVAMRVCREVSRRIPEDISLIGFDDLPHCTETYPALTTVRVDREYMGRLSVRRLYARLHAGNTTRLQPSICNQIPVSLIVRQSCRAL
jgi:DNA-binding LacI/PurR family transcriptional regulator